MLNRLRFWGRALKRGVTSLNTWAGWFGLVVLALGVVVGITVPVVFHVSHWVTVVIIMGAVLVVVAEGSYLEWKDSDELRKKADSDLESTRTELGTARRELEEARRPAISAPPKTGLEVVIDTDNPTPFPGVGLILMIEFKVTNHDLIEHTLSRRIESESTVYFGPHGVTDDPEHAPLWQAFNVFWDQQRGRELPRSVRPGETVRGVWVVEFDWDPERKLPDYTLVISDGRREYRVRPHGPVENTPIEPKPPPLKLRYYTNKGPLAGSRAASHFVAVKNPPDQPERRARIFADGMDPYPRNRSQFAGVEPKFSHPVPPQSGGAAVAGRVIGPGQEQSWYLGQTWIRGDGKISVSRFFSETDADWLLDPDERWRIFYRIECDGVPDKPFSVVLAVEDGQLVVRLEGG